VRLELAELGRLKDTPVLAQTLGQRTACWCALKLPCALPARAITLMKLGTSDAITRRERSDRSYAPPSGHRRFAEIMGSCPAPVDEHLPSKSIQNDFFLPQQDQDQLTIYAPAPATNEPDRKV
jgi:hypothetical protein